MAGGDATHPPASTAERDVSLRRINKGTARRSRWTVPLSLAVILLTLTSTLLNGAVIVSERPTAPYAVGSPPESIAPRASPLPSSPLDYLPSSGSQLCQILFDSLVYTVYGYVCELGFSQGASGVVAGTRPDAINNTVIDLYNYLNQTASGAATFNATSQELLSYYADRAEAMAAYYVNQSWSPLVADEVATYSGFAASVEGMVTAIGEQEYQDWNASVQSFQNKFGAGQIYCCSGTTNMLVAPYPNPTADASGIFVEGDQPQTFSITAPWEVWPSLTPSGANQSYYFNIEPGGTLLNANFDNASGSGANWTVTDLTTGANFPVPSLSFNAWVADSPTGSGRIAPLTQTYHVGQFDLLKATCDSGCAGGWPDLLTSGAYVFTNLSALKPRAIGSIPQSMEGNAVLFADSHVGGVLGNANLSVPLPLPGQGVCIGGTSAFAGAGACSTETVPTGGFATDMSSGPGQVVGGTGALSGYGQTLEQLSTNVLVLAQAYHDVLRAITDNGTYAIPPLCSLPFPSDAFPSATNPAVYGLSVPNVEVAYLAYLGAVGRVFGTTFTGSMNVCGDSNLGIVYNWSSSWQLKLNLTASVYLGSPSGAVYANGSLDTSSVIADPSTWPIRDVSPAILYPYEFDMNVPVGAVYPIPLNDPTAALLINYTGNEGYGTYPLGHTPKWGVPAYLTLNGHGDYVYVSGASSTTSSGLPNSTADAIYISSCDLAGVSKSVCPLSAIYFNNFTFGVIHANLAPSCASLGTCPSSSGGFGTLGGLGSGCGFQALDQWYDGWAGYIGSTVAGGFSAIGSLGSGIPVIGGGWSGFWNGLGCVLAWIVVIIVFFVLVYFVVVAARWLADAWWRR